MTAYDVTMLAVVFPAVVVPLWIVVRRVWREGRDVYDDALPVRSATPESARHGYHAFLLPVAVSMTLSGPATAAYVVWESSGRSPSWLEDVFLWLFLVCFVLVLLGFWLWAWMWPRLLVPPHLRDQPGWVLATWRGRRSGGRAR